MGEDHGSSKYAKEEFSRQADGEICSHHPLKLLIYRLDLRQRDRLLQAAGEKGMQHT
jgi:hypothetical protein